MLQSAPSVSYQSLEALRSHLWEEEYILDGRGIGHKHCKTVDSHSESRCRRHTVLECTYKVHIDEHRLVISLILQLELILETLVLVDRVVQLAVCVSKLLSAYEKLEALCELRICAVTLCEWRHFHRVVCDECRLGEVLLAIFSEDCVDELALSE